MHKCPQTWPTSHHTGGSEVWLSAGQGLWSAQTECASEHLESCGREARKGVWNPSVPVPEAGDPLVTPPLSGHNTEWHTWRNRSHSWWTEDPHALKSQDFQLRFWAVSSLTHTPVETAFSYSRLSKESQTGLPSGWLLCFLLLYGIFGPPRTFCRCTPVWHLWASKVYLACGFQWTV